MAAMAKFIDFETVGCHYRAWDLAKFFRTSHATDWTDGNRRLFLERYSNSSSQSTSGREDETITKLGTPASLLLELESRLLLPMTWLEAAMFFETIGDTKKANHRKRHYEQSRAAFLKDVRNYQKQKQTFQQQ